MKNKRIRYWAGYITRSLQYVHQHGVIRTYRRLRQRHAEQKTSAIEFPSLPKRHSEQPAINETKKFSIIAVLSGAPIDGIKTTVDYMLAQVYQNWELVIVKPFRFDSLAYEKVKSKYGIHPKIHYIETDESSQGSAFMEGSRVSTGDFIMWLRPGDLLVPQALLHVFQTLSTNSPIELLYTDWVEFDANSNQTKQHFSLPDISPDYLRSRNYIGNAAFFSRKLLNRMSGNRDDFSGVEIHELLLRILETTRHIAHIRETLYWHRSDGNETVGSAAVCKAIEEHIKRIGYTGQVTPVPNINAYRIHYSLKHAKVSIVIPSKDHIGELRKCINSILKLSTYPEYEIIIMENNSTEKKTFSYYESLKTEPRIKVICMEIKGYNYSRINNHAAKEASGDYLLLLNNDTVIITPGWIEEMLMYAQRDDVGAVGAFLLYPDRSIQHCGLVLGYRGNIAGNPYYGEFFDENNAPPSLRVPQNYSAVTAACTMVKRTDYFAVGGLDETDFAVGLNDVDFCLKLREAGLWNVWTPYAMLYHNESASRGSDMKGKPKARFDRECEFLKSKWQRYFIEGDPYHF